MQLGAGEAASCNPALLEEHERDLEYVSRKLSGMGMDAEAVIEKVGRFQVALPSWALGTGGTRFGGFPMEGEPRSIEEKLSDAAIVRALTAQTSSVSLHIPWDTPRDPDALRELARELGLGFDAMNSNTFQDQPGGAQTHSYKFGSLCHTDARVREQAIAHHLDVIEIGKQLGSRSMCIWLADGSSFPGQSNFRKAALRTLESLREIYAGMPEDWVMLIEHKAFEPAFYSTVVNDWGSSLLLATGTGERALCLVDLGHHLPNTNIEQIVSRLLGEGRLGGFHFNDSKYADDDLTAGCMRPFQLFLIFVELVEFLEGNEIRNPEPAWMIDASHNLKDPLEDLIQGLEAIAEAYAQALLVDRGRLEEAQETNDVVLAQEILQRAYRTDVRALAAEARRRAGAALDPIGAIRKLNVRRRLIEEREA